MDSIVEARLKELGHELPATPAPVGSYVPAKRFGNLVVTAGQLPVRDQVITTGKVDSDVSIEEGARAAELATLNCLAQIRAVIGSLDNIGQIIRVEGYVNSSAGFVDQAKVMNGASDLLAEAFGEVGRHTRIAVGASELPLNAAVEVVVWAEVADGSFI